MSTFPTPVDDLFRDTLNRLLQRVATLESQVAAATGAYAALPCTSSTHPANPVVGAQILETDTGNELIWDGSAWDQVQTGPWTAYTPSWTSSGTAPSVGGGTLTGRYSKIGRTVTAEIRMYGGSGTGFGTGVYSFSLPFTAYVAGAPGGAFVHTGTWVCTNSGSAYWFVGATISQSAPTVVQGVSTGTANQFGATAPATWNANSSFVCTITYESTS